LEDLVSGTSATGPDPQTRPVEHPPTALDRRTVIRAAGIAGVGVVGVGSLAACGGDAKNKAADTVGSVTDAAKGAIKAAEIPVGGGKVFPATKTVITQPTSGQFKAFTAVCTHRGCIVATVADGTINCPCHGSKYDIATGEVKNGPATKGLAAKSVSVGDDGIKVT